MTTCSNSSTTMDAKLYPVVAISNIRTFIPVVLDNETAGYVTWYELFRIHCIAFQVQGHIEPNTSPLAISGDKAKLQCIYGTISQVLLQTIIKPKTTAYDAWCALQTLFQDNKPSRALYLHRKLINTRLENSSDMETYCREIKVLSYQLTNVDIALSNQQLVLQLFMGLTEQYETTTTVLKN
ncbi:uncharacterized protein LOC143570542 [Bidens hawaiensis]|uniref:uncharacterized protein LOC143570542 n=1 Tax=Bidens hawaiensis TaxID=980011 RepID=UPI00404AF5EB